MTVDRPRAIVRWIRVLWIDFAEHNLENVRTLFVEFFILAEPKQRKFRT